jgi:hypothetical protein
MTLTPTLSLRVREFLSRSGALQTAVTLPADWRPPFLEEFLLPMGEGQDEGGFWR